MPPSTNTRWLTQADWINAKQIENSGCGLIANENNYENEIPKLINNFLTFKKNYLKYSNNENGAEEAANIIVET